MIAALQKSTSYTLSMPAPHADNSPQAAATGAEAAPAPGASWAGCKTKEGLSVGADYVPLGADDALLKGFRMIAKLADRFDGSTGELHKAEFKDFGFKMGALQKAAGGAALALFKKVAMLPVQGRVARLAKVEELVGQLSVRNFRVLRVLAALEDAEFGAKREPKIYDDEPAGAGKQYLGMLRMALVFGVIPQGAKPSKEEFNMFGAAETYRVEPSLSGEAPSEDTKLYIVYAKDTGEHKEGEKVQLDAARGAFVKGVEDDDAPATVLTQSPLGHAKALQSLGLGTVQDDKFLLDAEVGKKLWLAADGVPHELAELLNEDRLITELNEILVGVERAPGEVRALLEADDPARLKEFIARRRQDLWRVDGVPEMVRLGVAVDRSESRWTEKMASPRDMANILRL